MTVPLMAGAMFKLPLASLFFASLYHYAYATFVNPVFEYAHYLYLPAPFFGLFFTYLAVVAPVCYYRSSCSPASYGIELVYALCYVPSILVFLFTWQRSPFELMLVQFGLGSSMFLLLRAPSWRGKSFSENKVPNKLVTSILGVVTLLAILELVRNYHSYMRFVSFADVYDLRFETNAVEIGPLSSYSIMWLSYCFLPFYFARGIITKSITDFGIGISGGLLLYAATGAKGALLMGGIVFGISVLYGSGKQFLFRLLFGLAAAIFFIAFLLPNEGPLFWVKSILLVRVLGTTGWTTATYYEFFTSNGFTYYTHIGPINALTGAYPYGEYQLGQLIGLEYSGSADANFNSNFWASDAFAAMGLLGLPIATLALGAVVRLIDYVSLNYNRKFVVLWLSGFWFAVLNFPLAVALLSGGGFITMLVLFFGASRIRMSKGNRAHNISLEKDAFITRTDKGASRCPSSHTVPSIEKGHAAK